MTKSMFLIFKPLNAPYFTSNKLNLLNLLYELSFFLCCLAGL